jgi:hypothetical protein
VVDVTVGTVRPANSQQALTVRLLSGIIGDVTTSGARNAAGSPIDVTAANERQEWLQMSLEGLERWEAKHGLGQDDDL